MTAMNKSRIIDVISVDPSVMHGTPCFQGTRVPVQTLLNDLKGGFNIAEFLEGCPTVTRDQVDQYLELAQELVAECAVS